MLITSASSIFKELANGRNLIKTTSQVHRFDGRGQGKLFVPNPPISGTPVLEYWNATDWAVADTTVYAREVMADDGLILLTNAVFHRVRWRVTYDGGYEQANIPLHFKEAICELVDRAEQKAQGKQGVDSETIGNQSTTFDLKTLVTEPIKIIASYAKVFAT